MKRICLAAGRLALLAAFVLAVPPLAAAGTADKSHASDSAMKVELERWLVGFDVVTIKRGVEFDAYGKQSLDARYLAGVVGYDVLPWLTPFVTAGKSKAQLSNMAGYGDQQWAFTVGANANVWRTDVVEPEFMAGQLSLKILLEYGRYQSSKDIWEVKWSEWYAAPLLTYEMFAETEAAVQRVPYSLVLAAGPAFSALNGTEKSSVTSMDFSQKESVGYLLGLDIFIAHNLSVGAQLVFFDHTTVDGSIRYRF